MPLKLSKPGEIRYRCVVFETFDHANKSLVKKYTDNSVSVFAIEPCVAYHRIKGDITGFPNDFPDYAQQLIDKGAIQLLLASSFDGKSIYAQALDKAVDVIEPVFPVYKENHKQLIKYVCNTLNSPDAEKAFKKSLCERLATFYSINILLHRLNKLLGYGPILTYPDANIRSYIALKKLLLQSEQEVFEHDDIQLPTRIHISSFCENLKRNLIINAQLLAQTSLSVLLGWKKNSSRKSIQQYTYGITIVGSRQLEDNRRGPDFIIDDKKIAGRSVVYFPRFDLTTDQIKRVSDMPGTIWNLPKAKKFFSHPGKWKHLLWLSVRRNFVRNAEEMNIASEAVFHYFCWLKVLNSINIRHFITHGDFGTSHIGRNIALKQAGIQTWYFTDSMNCGSNMQEKGNRMRHPFWTYLHYDRFVTWNTLLAEYFRSHPGSFQKADIVGCLWSDHIVKGFHEKNQANIPSPKTTDPLFFIVVFDTTYSRNGLVSYAEGIAFAEHIIDLANEKQGIHVILKEKKHRSIHRILDPKLGPELLSLYNKMDAHPKITVYLNESDASELISISDMVISSPFTSTTFETLSANKPAIWHDPMGLYKHTPYGMVGGITTHSYIELKKKMLEIMEMNSPHYKNPLPPDSSLIDPYRDGKAIDRFRDLLTYEQG
ncbi:MAG: polysaccharide biosynthesis PFTS motif protein [Chloroflexi bacterium]|jgi:polysaccharide biosynthesis PFTS motif protein|nr:polysaccharide biosynthesis PFTS motif protein [Chloroflexota bacterium]